MKHFRFLSYLLVAVFCLSLTSCHDDDEWTAADVVGDWSVTRIEGYYYENGRKKIVNDYFHEGDWIFAFDRDRTGFEDDGRYIYDFEWTVMNGNRIILSGDYGTTRTFYILRLNRNHAVVEEEGNDFFYRIELRALDYYWD